MDQQQPRPAEKGALGRVSKGVRRGLRSFGGLFASKPAPAPQSSLELQDFGSGSGLHRKTDSSSSTETDASTEQQL